MIDRPCDRYGLTSAENHTFGRGVNHNLAWSQTKTLTFGGHIHAIRVWRDGKRHFWSGAWEAVSHSDSSRLNLLPRLMPSTALRFFPSQEMGI
jgi:hypothetical protein